MIRTRPLLLALAVVTMFAVSGAIAVPATGTSSAPAADSTAGDQVATPEADLSKTKAKNRKLQASLAQLVEASNAAGPAAAEALATTLSVPLQGGMVQVVAEVPSGGSSALIEKAASLGITVETSYDDLVQLRVHLSGLERLADDTAVRFVRRPLAPVPLGSTVGGEGVPLINADDWQAAGFTGAGTRVAILDLGFQGYDTLLGTELPASVTTKSCRSDQDLSGGGQVHGAAVAEIVHEVAPDAQLFLANFNTGVEFGNCVDWLVAQGVQIVNHSVGFFASGPGDGTGFVNDVVNTATSQGVVWVNSAGNHAQNHWSALWSDPGANDWHNFNGGDETNAITASAGEVIYVILRWDDPFGQSCNDYDLYLFNSSMTIVAISDEFQDFCLFGFPTDPVEVIAFQAPTTGTYHVGINRWDANGQADFDLYSLGHACPDLQFCVESRSVLEPGDNPNVLTAGAVFWGSPTSLESFSSQGPTTDGRVKPDLVAPDGVGSATYGSFFGTSASSPHTAGAAALVQQSQPGWSQNDIRPFLTSRALDLGAPGADNLFGLGRLDLGAPPAPPPASGIDTDGDGCDDALEQGSIPSQGGLRDPNFFWDFFDTPNAGNSRDGVIGAADITRIVVRFGTSGDPAGDPLTPPPATGYHTAFDRSPQGQFSGPADGAISAADITLVVAQFGHSCAGGP